MSSTIREMVVSAETNDFAGRAGVGDDLWASVAVAMHLAELSCHELGRLRIRRVFIG